jgi:UDP:flavonoid glycosyltransferase YjiC (YdhE family)
MSKRILIATIGSLGDLHPFLAIALELQRRGAHPVLAIPATHVPKAHAAGLEAHAIMPDFAGIGERLGIGDVISAKYYSGARAREILRELLADRSIAERALKTGERLRRNDGAANAADVLLAV